MYVKRKINLCSINKGIKNKTLRRNSKTLLISNSNDFLNPFALITKYVKIERKRRIIILLLVRPVYVKRKKKKNLKIPNQ